MTPQTDPPTFLSCSSALLDDAANAKPQPTIRNAKVPLSDLQMAPQVFQPRNLAGSEAASFAHVSNLANILSHNPDATLDAVEVWWSGRQWYVIDGHHRLFAYRQWSTSHKIKGPVCVPAKAFNGTFQAAVLRAISMNAKDKLPMTMDDKLNAAWKLVCLGGLSKRAIALATSVSERTVGHMRACRKSLLAKKVDDTLNLSWKDALDLESEAERHEFDDEWMSQLARTWAKRMAKAFGDKLARQPDVAALALEYYSETLPAKLMESSHWPRPERLSDEDCEF